MKEDIEKISEKMFNDFRKNNPIVPKNNINPYKLGFIEGIKWEKEQHIDNSKEKLRLAFTEGHRVYQMVTDNTDEAQECFEEWYEQYKNK